MSVRRRPEAARGWSTGPWLGKRGDALPSRLLSLSEQFAALLAELRPTEVAVEEAFFGKSVQSALRIGEARGVVLAEAARAELTIHQYAPARIKRCVTGNGSARKESVAKMLEHCGRPAPAGQRLPPTRRTLGVAWMPRRSPFAPGSGTGRAGRATGGRPPPARGCFWSSRVVILTLGQRHRPGAEASLFFRDLGRGNGPWAKRRGVAGSMLDSIGSVA